MLLEAQFENYPSTSNQEGAIELNVKALFHIDCERGFVVFGGKLYGQGYAMLFVS